jgi:hypothetical protein
MFHFVVSPNNSPEQILIQIYVLKGIAFLPTHHPLPSPPSPSTSSSTSTHINSNDFEWRQVNVVRYNETTRKWQVLESKSGAIYEVPRIYLMFIGENVTKFVERIEHAVQLRDYSESHLRFEAILDAFGSFRLLPQPTDYIHHRIEGMLQRCKKESQEWIELFQREYTIVYQKFHAAMYLKKFIEEEQRKFKSNGSSPSTQIQLPTRQDGKLKNIFRPQIQQGKSFWIFYKISFKKLFKFSYCTKNCPPFNCSPFSNSTSSEALP